MVASVTMPTTPKTMNGDMRTAAGMGSRCPSTVRMMALKITNPSTRPARGEMNQLSTIWPIFPQYTDPNPATATPKPATAPTMACDVETGMPNHVARWRQSAAESSALAMPRHSTSGSEASAMGSTMPLRIVFVTSEPTSTAPANSQMPATITAWRRLMDPEPTTGPIELATSLAPMVQAMYRPTAAVAAMTNQAMGDPSLQRET